MEINHHFSRAWGVLRKHPVAMVALATWPYVAAIFNFLIVVKAISTTAGATLADDIHFDPAAAWRSVGVPAKMAVVFSYIFAVWIAQGLAVAGVSMVTEESLSNGSPTSLHALGEIRCTLFPLLALSLLVGLGSMLLGSPFLVVGQFIVQSIFLPLTVVVLMIDRPRLSVWSSLKKGIDLSTRWLGTILAVGIGLGALLLVVAGALFALSNVQQATRFLPGLFFVIASSVVALGMGTLLTSKYHDLWQQQSNLPCGTANQQHTA